jgi:hypothetical protein
MTVASNPLGAAIKVPARPSTNRPKDRESLLTHQALEQAVSALQALLGDGDPRRGKAVEYHEDVPVTSTGTTVKHGLGRRPRGYVLTSQNGNRVVYGSKEEWTEENFKLRTGAGTVTCAFFIFALLFAALLAPTAQAAECAAYGYAQGEPVRFWLCEAATDTTTGAREGDYRYNKDSNGVQSYDGAAWNALGGGSGAPTNAQYWVGAADATLSAEHNLGALATGLVINTTGTPSAYTGTSCTNQFPRSLSASGAATCASVASADFGANILAAANGGTGIDTSATGVNRLMMTGSAGAWSAYAIPDCDDTGGNHLNYNDVAGGGPAWSCGTSSSGGTTPTGTGYRHVTGGVEDAAAVAPIPDSEGGTGSDTTVLGANRVFVTTGVAYSPFVLPDCDDTGGQHLNYDTTGPSFSCGTSGPAGSGLTYAQVAAAVLGGM